MSKIAWIGLGHMGVPMSKNMVDAGHTVLGVDIAEPARAAARSNGVTVVPTVAEAVRDVDAVFTMLQNGSVVLLPRDGGGAIARVTLPAAAQEP